MKEMSKQEQAAEETDDSEGREESGERDSPVLNDDDAEQEDEPAPKIKPLERKIGEGRDNLRRREEWFRRRSGR